MAVLTNSIRHTHEEKTKNTSDKVKNTQRLYNAYECHMMSLKQMQPLSKHPDLLHICFDNTTAVSV